VQLRLKVFLGILGILLSTSGCLGQSSSKPSSEALWIPVSGGRIKAQAFKSADLAADPTLLIVLHGDLLEPNDSYHYRFAEAIAARASNVVAVGLIRPGYVDEAGDRSSGDRLRQTGDNYTSEVAQAVATAAAYLKSRYGAGSVVIAGHSGGAAIAALMLGRHTELVDAALLVACPCNLPAWRAHMKALQESDVWDLPHQGLSAIDFTPMVRKSAVVRLEVGSDDTVTPPEYSTQYAAALVERGIDAQVSVLEGLDHRILLQPAIQQSALDLISSMAREERTPR
jgi:poly(3-hydroxybutyrate) depolymerase